MMHRCFHLRDAFAYISINVKFDSAVISSYVDFISVFAAQPDRKYFKMNFFFHY